jgi:hypothetical protein
MPVPSQGHYGFHSFPVVDWFCLFIYLWVLTFPLLDCSEFMVLKATYYNISVISWQSILYKRVFCTQLPGVFHRSILLSLSFFSFYYVSMYNKREVFFYIINIILQFLNYDEQLFIVRDGRCIWLSVARNRCRCMYYLPLKLKRSFIGST